MCSDLQQEQIKHGHAVPLSMPTMTELIQIDREIKHISSNYNIINKHNNKYSLYDAFLKILITK